MKPETFIRVHLLLPRAFFCSELKYLWIERCWA